MISTTAARSSGSVIERDGPPSAWVGAAGPPIPGRQRRCVRARTWSASSLGSHRDGHHVLLVGPRSFEHRELTLHQSRPGVVAPGVARSAAPPARGSRPGTRTGRRRPPQLVSVARFNAEHDTTTDPCSLKRRWTAASHGRRSASVSATPDAILSTLIGGCRSSPSTNSAPICSARRRPVVVLPQPATPMMTTRSMLHSRYWDPLRQASIIRLPSSAPLGKVSDGAGVAPA